MRAITDAEGSTVGRFDYFKAQSVFDATDLNGQGTELLRTAGGRLVLAHRSQWANVPTVYSGDAAEVAEFCLAHNIDAPEAVESVPSWDGPGRPAIGPEVTVRMGQNLITLLDRRAAEKGVTRAQLIRDLLADNL